MRLYDRLCIVLVSTLAILLPAVLASAQPPIPHPLQGRNDCLSCHEAGAGGAPQVPADHAGRSNESCPQCHLEGGGLASIVPPVPHPAEGREACLTCHAEGLGDAPRVPGDHAGRTDESCRRCHLTVSTTPATVPTLPAVPSAPHPLEGWEACLACHAQGVGGASKVPDDHRGRTDASCRECHQAASVAKVPVYGPSIPHLVAGGEACLMCHTEGLGGAPKIPDDHAGRPNEVCRTCHQPPVVILVTPTPPPIPTPIQHPIAPGEDACLECHRGLGGKYGEIVRQWEGSIHATYNVTCADCHGGDPGARDKTAAKSPEAGYIGLPDRDAIPYLCGSCHADPEIMRPFALPIDQLRNYETSVHGQRLAQGDENVPTCYDCHGGHDIRAVDDPASSLHPRQLPATCAKCHADKERMKPYGIATNQFDLYRESVHGRALMTSGNTKAPSCPTCHSSHGATLPGYSEVIDMCGQCHSTSEKYYLIGGHRRGREKGSEAPRCITCHGRYDVAPSSLEFFVGDESRHCGFCHPPGSLKRVAIDKIYQALTQAGQVFQKGEEALREAQTLGMRLDKQEGRLEEARAALVEAAAIQHTVDLEAVREKTSEVEAISAEVLESVEQATARRKLERLVLGWITVIIIGLGAAVFYGVRRLKINR